MKKLLKVLGLIFVLLSFLAAGGIFYASKKINSERIHSIVVEKIQEVFPSAKVQLKKVDYSLGLTITVDFLDLDLKLKKDQSPLLHFSKAEAKIALIPFLLGTGKATVRIEDPQINVHDVNKINNWTLALKNSETKVLGPKSSSKNQGAEEEIGLEFSPFATFLVDVGVYNAVVKYVKDNEETLLKVDKVKVNDLGFSRIASFEVITAFEKKDSVSLNAMVIGELDVSHLIKEKEIQLTLNNQLTNITLSKLGKIPNISAEAKLKITSNKNINTTVKGTIGDDSLFSTSIMIERKKTSFSDVKFSLHLPSILRDLTVKDHLSEIDYSKAVLNLEGSLVLDDNKVIPDLKGKLGPDLVIIRNKIKSKSAIEFSWTKEKTQIHITTNALDGQIDSDFSFKFDPLDFDIKKLTPIDVAVHFQDIKYVEKIRAKSTNTEDILNRGSEEQPKEKDSLFIVPMALSATFQNCMIGQAPVNGDLDLIVTNKSMKLIDMNLNIGDGILKGQFLVVFGNRIKGDFSLSINRLNLSAFNGLYSFDSFKEATGLLDFDSKGEFEINSKISYKAKGKLAAQSFGVAGFDGGKYLTQYVKNIPALSPFIDKEFKLESAPHIDSISSNYDLNNERVKLTGLKSIIGKKVADLSGKGEISLVEKGSYLQFDLRDRSGKLSKTIEKDFGMKAIPVRIEGQGFSLLPNYDYTVKKMGKKAAKAQSKKIINKQIDKFLKGKSKEDAKKLLKGLFE